MHATKVLWEVLMSRFLGFSLVSFAAVVWARYATLPPPPKQRLRRRLFSAEHFRKICSALENICSRCLAPFSQENLLSTRRSWHHVPFPQENLFSTRRSWCLVPFSQGNLFSTRKHTFMVSRAVFSGKSV